MVHVVKYLSLQLCLKKVKPLFSGLVVQLVRTLACHARGRGFDSHPGRHLNASVAQSVEQGTENPRVDGSIPSGGTIKNMLERRFYGCHFYFQG